jgi:ubiquinone/menaquinone biosynthesis C-methylase UbiE
MGVKMSYLNSHKKVKFYLPPERALEPNGPDDPLPYYYKPIIGRFYCKRIENGLSLLSPPYESILELGYGSGILMPTLCSIANTVQGIDIESEPEKIKSNLKRIGVYPTLLRSDVSKMKYSEESFDLIVAFSIFEHIYDLSPILQKVFNILRPGGEFLVGMPRVDFLMVNAFRIIGYQNIEEHHVTNYQSFLKKSNSFFTLKKFSKMPKWAPSFTGLYFNMLLQKKTSY